MDWHGEVILKLVPAFHLGQHDGLRYRFVRFALNILPLLDFNFPFQLVSLLVNQTLNFFLLVPEVVLLLLGGFLSIFKVGTVVR